MKFLLFVMIFAPLCSCKVRTSRTSEKESSPDIEFFLDRPGAFNLPDKIDLKTVDDSFKKREPIEIMIVEAPDKNLRLGFFYYDIHYFAKRTESYRPSAY